MDEAFGTWLEQVWTERDERVYRSLFGDLGKGPYVAGDRPYHQFNKPAHPGWLHHAVFACPPNAERDTWLYVTSGLSNPWNLSEPERDPTGFSGVGFELVIETPTEAPWAVPLLHNLMAYELLVAVGTYEGQQLFEYGNRVPLNAAIDGEGGSAIRWLLIEQPKHYPSAFELPSGRVDLFHLVGATDEEVKFARQTNQDMLVALLQREGAHPATDAGRKSLR
ncbi:MAG: hypothetical protein RL398_3135 [Planctomycetota bacterium]|jgi:hypothetical protein